MACKNKAFKDFVQNYLLNKIVIIKVIPIIRTNTLEIWDKIP